MIMYLNFTMFFLMTLLVLGGKILLFQWSVDDKKKKNGTKKVGHIYKFISCTGLAYTGRSLFSIALDSITMDL